MAIDVRADAERLVARVRGEIDMETAPLLRSVLRGVLDGGHRDVVVDLEDVQFLGASGLGVIAEAASRLRLAGGVLSLRSASPMTVRMMAITRLTDLVGIDTGDRSEASVTADREPAAEDKSATIGRAPVEIVSELVRVGSMITAVALVDRALQLVTVLAKAAIAGADGVSVSLERHERMSTVAWSNDTVLQMDLHQYQTGEGPCVDAANTGEGVYSDSLASEGRWPAFVPKALGEGIASILSTPLIAPARSVGALNIYSNTEAAFGDAQHTLAGLFAEQASGIIAASLTDLEFGARLARALIDREVIAQAQGVLMARRGIAADDAAAELISAARAATLTVSQHGASVVASTQPEHRQ